MNYKIFLSLATTGRWEKIVHIDQDLQWCPIQYLHITKPVICTVIYKVINYNTILILRPQNYDEPLSCIYTCMVYYSPLKTNIDLMQIYGTSAKTWLMYNLSQWIEHHVQATLAANCSPTLSASFSNSLLKGRSKYYNRYNNICI